MSATKSNSRKIGNLPKIDKGLIKERRKRLKAEQSDGDINGQTQPLPRKILKGSSVICIDDDQQVEGINPSKRLKQDANSYDNHDEVIFQRQTSSIKIQNGADERILKIIRLNHFFKLKDKILFEVMVGYSSAEICRWPQVVAYQELLSNQETKAMAYQLIASACKSIILNEEDEIYPEKQNSSN